MGGRDLDAWPPGSSVQGAVMSISESGQQRIMLAFQERYWADRVEGREPSLARFLGLYPEHPTLIAREFLRMEGEDQLNTGVGVRRNRMTKIPSESELLRIVENIPRLREMNERYVEEWEAAMEDGDAESVSHPLEAALEDATAYYELELHDPQRPYLKGIAAHDVGVGIAKNGLDVGARDHAGALDRLHRPGRAQARRGGEDARRPRDGRRACVDPAGARRLQDVSRQGFGGRPREGADQAGPRG